MPLNAKYLGTWEFDTTQFKGVEDFAKAMGAPVEEFQKEISHPHTYTTSLEGENCKLEVDFKGALPNGTYVLKDGEEIDYTFPNGQIAKLTLTYDAEGNPIETFRIPEANIQWVDTRSIDGDVISVVSTVGETSMTAYYKKV